jgi:hypothetical protein
MVNHKDAPRSLLKRLNGDLREHFGTSAPEALHLWAEAAYPRRGVTLSAHLLKGEVEQIAVGSGNWEEAYQEMLTACLDAWCPIDQGP